jgi:hypothetical protein
VVEWLCPGKLDAEHLNSGFSGHMLNGGVFEMASFLERTILIACVSAIPTFASLGGGHSSGGSNSGHSSSASSSGHSSSSSNGGHLSSASKGGHPASDPITAPATVVGGRSVSGTSVRLSTNRNGPVPVAYVRHFSTGYVPSDWQENDDLWRRRHDHHRFLFGLFP